MPIINTNDPILHKKVRDFASDNDTTIGKTYEAFARLGLKLGLSMEKIREILESDRGDQFLKSLD